MSKKNIDVTFTFAFLQAQLSWCFGFKENTIKKQNNNNKRRDKRNEEIC